MIYTALIGYPTKYSLSPHLFKIYADSIGIESAHLKIDVNANGDELQKSLNALKQLGFSGLNVTIPHKLNVIDYLDDVDDFALKIGAVNTISIKNGCMRGSNTDYIGAVKSIQNSVGAISPTSKAVIFGTGGAAKACTAGLLQYIGNVTVCFREPESNKTSDFRARFSDNVQLISINDNRLKEKLMEADIICNATPVGMTPDNERSILPISTAALRDNPIKRTFFDCVYTPLHTKFLMDAKKAGYGIADGLDMMIHQGIQAFQIWTDQRISEEIANKVRHYILDLRKS